jgi:hypothetical protein
MGFDLSVNMCVCVFMYIFIYFRRKELRASLDTICSDIDELNFLDCSNELLVLLWPKFYRKDKPDLLTSVSQVHERFMCEPRAKLPFKPAFPPLIIGKRLARLPLAWISWLLLLHHVSCALASQNAQLSVSSAMLSG